MMILHLVYRDIRYVFNVCPCLWYFRLYKLFVPVMRLCVSVTYYPVKYISKLFVLVVNIIKIWGRFRANGSLIKWK